MQKVIRPDNISFLQKCQINAGDSMSTIKLLVNLFFLNYSLGET